VSHFQNGSFSPLRLVPMRMRSLNRTINRQPVSIRYLHPSSCTSKVLSLFSPFFFSFEKCFVPAPFRESPCDSSHRIRISFHTCTCNWHLGDGSYFRNDMFPAWLIWHTVYAQSSIDSYQVINQIPTSQAKYFEISPVHLKAALYR